MPLSDVYLCGYYGMKNTGDDALLLASSWGIREFFNTDNIRVSTPHKIMLNNKIISPNLISKQRFLGENRLRHYFSSLMSKRIVFGGGSVFHTAQDINIKRHLIHLSGNNQSHAIGVSFGPFTNVAAEKSCKKFIRNCDFIGVRDKESYAIAESLTNRNNIKLTFDLAPCLLASRYYSKKHAQRHGIAFCLCPTGFTKESKLEQYKLIKKISKTIIHVFQETQEPIYLIDFNGHETLGDSQIHEALNKLLPKEIPVQHINYNPNVIRVLQNMRKFRAVVSMRLHASIFSFLTETPFISLNYHTKCKGWNDQIGAPKENQFSIDQLCSYDLSQAMLNGLFYGFSTPAVSVSTAVKRSLTNWSLQNESTNSSYNRCYSSL